MHLGELLGPDVLEILNEDPAAVREALASMHPADVAELLSGFQREDRLRMLAQLEPVHLGDTLVYADGETIKLALTRCAPETIAAALDHLESDDVANILSAIPEEKRAPILTKMRSADAAAAGRLLRYEPGTAGRLMTSKFVRIRPEQSVQEVLDALRTIDPHVATVADLYAVDGSDRLQGVVSLRRLLPANPPATVASLMTREVVSVAPETPQDEVARLVSKYGFSALPVIDAENRILGIITVDDVVDVLVAGETEAMLRMGGVAAATEDEPWNRGFMNYFGTSIVRVVRMRLGWLLLLFVAETLTGSVLRYFEAELAQSGGAVVLHPADHRHRRQRRQPDGVDDHPRAGARADPPARRLARAAARDHLRLPPRRAAVHRRGSAHAAVEERPAIVDGGRPDHPQRLRVGQHRRSVIPLLAQRFRIDPTVVSAPLITTLVDATGLAIYLMIAKVILHL